MVICKFFQQGNCRYGQNCRFDHIYSSKYSYNASQPSQQDFASLQVKDEQLVNQVHADVQSALRGGQWLLSSYAPFKEKAPFPGLNDLSPEEARLFIYEAKSNNNLDQAVAHMNNLFSEARQKYEILLQKNQNITNILRSIYKGEPVSSPFDHLTGGNSSAMSIFRSALQSNTGFNKNTSTFGQNNFVDTNDPAKSLFANATQNVFSNNQSSIFAPQNTQTSPNQNIFQQNAFNQQTTNPKSVFAEATQNTFNTPQSNVFAQNPPANGFTPCAQENTFFGQSQPTNPTSVFANAAQSTFNQAQNSQQNIFKQPENKSSSFGISNVYQQVNTDDVGVYSKIDEMSADDLEAFKSEDFKMGFVPELPPPHSLCF